MRSPITRALPGWARWPQPCRPAVRPVARMDLQAAARQRHRHRHRSDDLRNRARLLLRKALCAARRAGSSGHSARFLVGHSTGRGGAQRQCAVPGRRRLAFAAAWMLKNTRIGLTIRVTGDSADAARAIGIDVNRVRLWSTAAGGALAGVGGAYLSLYYPGSWNEGISSGQGLMAVALVIFARWNRSIASTPPCCSAGRERSVRRCNRSASPAATICSTPRLTCSPLGCSSPPARRPGRCRRLRANSASPNRTRRNRRQAHGDLDDHHSGRSLSLAL